MLSRRMGLAAIASVAVYLGLAILGEGGFGAYFSKAPLVALTVVFVGLTVLSLFTAGNISTGEREDRGNRWVLIAIGVLGLVSAWLPAFTDRVGFWTLDGQTVRWVGVALTVVGGVLRLWPVFVLGRRFSGLVAIQPGHSLVTNGVYSVIRHPSYVGLIIGTIGWALAFRSGVGLVLAALTVLPLLARIYAEERMLRSQFGEEYDAYRARTWRLVPGLW